MLLLPWLVLVYGKSLLVRYSAPVHMCHVVIGPKCSTVLLLSFPSSIFLLICLLLLFFFFLFSISNLFLTCFFLTSSHSCHISLCLSSCYTSAICPPITTCS